MRFLKNLPIPPVYRKKTSQYAKALKHEGVLEGTKKEISYLRTVGYKKGVTYKVRRIKKDVYRAWRIK